jgi:ParB-like nuclease domain.
MTEFDAARRAAIMTDLLRVLRGQQTDLLPFDAMRKELGLHGMIERGTAEVQLGVIVGTIGREREFNRAFLPRSESIRGRWKSIENLAHGLKGFPPVELYKVGDVYFVADGHHRISVARSVGAKSIEVIAYGVRSPSSALSSAPLQRIQRSEILLRTRNTGELEA